MPGIVDLIYTKYIRRYSTLIIALILLIIFSLVGWYGYKKFYADKKDEAVFKNVANANTRGKPIQIMFFYADWCPHCKKAKPFWFQFKEEYDGKTINGWLIECTEVNCTDEDDAKTSSMISQFKIESYPTIFMLMADNRIDFDAKVTKDSLTQFVQSATK